MNHNSRKKNLMQKEKEEEKKQQQVNLENWRADEISPRSVSRELTLS